MWRVALKVCMNLWNCLHARVDCCWKRSVMFQFILALFLKLRSLLLLQISQIGVRKQIREIFTIVSHLSTKLYKSTLEAHKT